MLNRLIKERRQVCNLKESEIIFNIYFPEIFFIIIIIYEAISEVVLFTFFEALRKKMKTIHRVPKEKRARATVGRSAV